MAETILVCVTGQNSSLRLIRKGAALAQEHDASLLVLSVSGSGLNTLSDPGFTHALDELYRLSSQVGAEMTMLHAPDAHKAICDFARERHVTRMVLGQAVQGSNAFVSHLMRSLPKVSFVIEMT